MEKSKLEIFLDVVEAGNFSSVAESLNYTPSGLNRMMSSLEDELGITLFHRNKKGITLTNEGSLVFNDIKDVVNAQNKLKENIDSILGLEKGNINIGTIYSIAGTILPKMIANFKIKYPNITIHIMQGSHGQINEWLKDNKIDLAFTTKRENINHWISLKKDPLVVWVNKDSYLNNYDSINYDILNKEPYIITLPNEDTDSEYFASLHNIHLNIQYTSGDNYTTYKMVEANLGISLNNEMMALDWNGNVGVKYINPMAYIELGIEYTSNISRCAKYFIDSINTNNMDS